MSTEKETTLVLVVDDDADCRDFVGAVLGDRYTLLYATNGDEAIQLCAGCAPALIIMDVIMPGGKDGLTTFLELQQKPETRGVPVILLSAVNAISGTNVDREGLLQFFGNAPAAFLEKPVEPQALLAQVEALLAHAPAAEP